MAQSQTTSFLRSKAALDALDKLASAGNLVLYCGAGVTIDRTGLSWSRLLQSTVELGKLGSRDGRDREHAALDHLVRTLPDEEQRASLITEYFTEKGDIKASDEFLTPILQQTLYRDNGWSEGALLRNVVRLAFMAAARMTSVTIITTNYDVFLEEEFEFVYKKLQAKVAAKGTEIGIPGLRRISNSLSASEWTICEMLAPISSTAMVTLVYVHGRVGRQGNPTEGPIVLDEYSYALTRSAVTKKIGEYVEDASVLCVGASLTDGPLVEALALSKKKNSSSQRFALVHPGFKVPPKSSVNQQEVNRLLAYRGSHLGLTVLHSGSHGQTAQFVEEARLRVQQHYRNPDEAYAQVGYEQRMRSWSEEWSENPPSPEHAYKTLAKALQQDVSKWLPPHEAEEENHGLRLEAWVRNTPGSSRTLTLFANSTGPLLVRPELLRKEVLEDGSKNASVQTFLQGRPMLHTLQQLGLDEGASSRWKAFLSVPLVLWLRNEVDGKSYINSIPAGVITLAGLESAKLEPRFNRLDLVSTKELVKTLASVGRAVLRPHEDKGADNKI